MTEYWINDNGVDRLMTPSEIAELKAEENSYWSQPYDILVDNEIRKKYSISAEFAILRQRDEKPEEYKSYFQYCEDCKAFVRKMRITGGGING